MSDYSRMHFYFTKTELEEMNSVFMQDREGARGPNGGVSFSPALHFLPVPEESWESA